MKKRLELENVQTQHLSKIADSQLKIFKDFFGVRLHAKRGKLTIQGDDEQALQCEKALQSVIEGLDRGKVYNDENIHKVCQIYSQQKTSEQHNTQKSKAQNLRFVEHLSHGQENYVQAMQNNVVTLAKGPAGSGKTFLAVGMAVQFLLSGKVDKIILVRPAVEAGEKLGFLPGDYSEKIKPYLLPLFDALRHFLGATRAEHYAEKGIIEIAPLAYMRGRTLDHCFMILDEAQNTTTQQMKMFLTRIGNQSRAVVTGDTSQIDLGGSKSSGMVHACHVLKNIENIQIVQLKNADIVRHPIVGKIVHAYEKSEFASENSNSPSTSTETK